MLSKLWLCCLVLFKVNASFSQNVVDIQKYIETYKDISVSEMRRTGVPAAITLAQGIHETLAGTSDLVRKSNNHFGIKCKSTWTGSVVYHDDDERGECFRSYDNPENSYRDHSDFLRNSPRYAFLFNLDPSDYSAWAYGLKRAGYATNKRYPEILIKLIKDYQLQQYTLIGLGKSSDALASQGSNMQNDGYGQNQPGNNQETKKEVPSKIAVQYPAGEFEINKSRVVFVKAGTSLLLIADQYKIPLSSLADFNELNNTNIVEQDQLIFLNRKRKISNREFHIVEEGESLYDICQREGVRYQSLLDMNQLSRAMKPAVGEKIYLQSNAPSRPALAVQ